MWLFSKKYDNTSKNSLNSAEYENCLKRFLELDTGIKLLRSEIEIIQTSMENLRGNFNRKLRGLKEEEEPPEKKSETIKSDEYIAFG